eukprot:1089688-Prorocentrum_minimum.AAC.1
MAPLRLLWLSSSSFSSGSAPSTGGKVPSSCAPSMRSSCSLANPARVSCPPGRDWGGTFGSSGSIACDPTARPRRYDKDIVIKKKRYAV